jgi:decaprenylphospho-beta-D-ribofuranose 2-oxidase
LSTLPEPVGVEQDQLLTGFGRTSPTRASVVAPRDVPDVQGAVSGVPARGLIARGLGRCYGDAAQNAGGRVLDMTRLDRIGVISADGRVRVEAGVPVSTLIRRALPHGWFVPVTPGTQHVTVGGAIAADVHGKNHHRDGAFSAHVEQLDLIDGTATRRTLRNGEPAFRATAGGLGLTGVIVEATIQLLAVETSRIRVAVERADDLDDLMRRMTDNDDRYRYSVAWVDLVSGARHRGRGVLERGDHAAIGDVDAKTRAAPLSVAADSAVPGPPWAPTGLMRYETARLCNEFWFRHAPRVGQRIVPLVSYFYPLDRVRGWNRVYGAGGFVQYQFVVPLAAGDTVRRVVERLAQRRCPVTLAVLKRLGAGTGMLSFPQAGWTLAVDVPARFAGLGDLLDGCDDLVVSAGGRVYLAKDARLAARHLERMYPQLAVWRAERDRLDPRGVLASDIARRLGLVTGDA